MRGKWEILMEIRVKLEYLVETDCEWNGSNLIEIFLTPLKFSSLICFEMAATIPPDLENVPLNWIDILK